MVFIELRPLLLILIAMILICVFYRIAKKIIRTENIKEAIEDRKDNIKETIKLSDSVPDVNESKLNNAMDKIKKFLK